MNKLAIIKNSKIREEEELEKLDVFKLIKNRVHNGHNENEPEGIPLLIITLITAKILHTGNEGDDEDGSIAEDEGLYKENKENKKQEGNNHEDIVERHLNLLFKFIDFFYT